MTRYKKGDVILVPFPFSDQTTAKKRPAVIKSLKEWGSQKIALALLGGEEFTLISSGERES